MLNFFGVQKKIANFEKEADVMDKTSRWMNWKNQNTKKWINNHKKRIENRIMEVFLRSCLNNRSVKILKIINFYMTQSKRKMNVILQLIGLFKETLILHSVIFSRKRRE